MAISDKTNLKSRFETGDRPTQADFENLLDTAIRDPLVAIASGAESGKTGILEIQGTAQVTAHASAGALPLTVDVTGAKRRPLKDRFGDRINAKDFLEADGITNDATAANALFTVLTSALAATSARRAVFFPHGTYRFDDTLRINAHRVGIEADQATFDFSNMTSGAAILIFNSAVGTPQLWRQWINSFRGVNIVGPGSTSEVDAVVFSGTNGTGANRVAFYDTRIDQFRTGLRFGDGSYMNKFFHVSIENCSVGARFPDGLDEAGEMFSFHGGLMGQNGIALLVSGSNADFSFHGTSFDFNDRLCEIKGGSQVYMHGCHWESGALTVNYPIKVSGNGATFSFIGGLALGGNTASTIDAHVFSDPDSDSGGVFFRDCFMNRFEHSVSGKFATGGGRVQLDNIHTFNNSNLPLMLGMEDEYNMLVDGGFEDTDVLDDIFILRDGGDIVSRVSGTFVTRITTSTTVVRTGSRALDIGMQFGAGGSRDVAVLVPCRAGESFQTEFYYNVSASGGFFVGAGYAKAIPVTRHVTENQVSGVANTANGEPYIWDSDVSNFASASSLTGGNWVKFRTSQNGRITAPHWATHYIVELRLGGVNGLNRSLYIDDMKITKVG